MRILGLNSYAQSQRHLLTEAMKTKRLKRCKKAVNFFKGNHDIVKTYSNKKIFTVDAVLNQHNDRFLAETKEKVLGIFRIKHPQQVTVLRVIASDSQKMDPHFYKRKEKIGTDVCYKVLRYAVLPWLERAFLRGNCCFTLAMVLSLAQALHLEGTFSSPTRFENFAQVRGPAISLHHQHWSKYQFQPGRHPRFSGEMHQIQHLEIAGESGIPGPLQGVLEGVQHQARKHLNHLEACSEEPQVQTEGSARAANSTATFNSRGADQDCRSLQARVFQDEGH